MDCRRCGACSIARSIKTAIPNMPEGRPASTRCVNLMDRQECAIYGRPERPAFCTGWRPAPEVRDDDFAAAPKDMASLERDSR
jgi:hypothetical protein